MYHKPLRILLILLAYVLIGISISSAQLIRPTYGMVQEPIDGSIIPVQDGKLFGFVDRKGKVLVAPKYEGVSLFTKDGYAQINQFGLYGIIDKSGKEVIPPISKNLISWKGSENILWREDKYNYEYLKHIKYVSNEKSKKILFYNTSIPNKVSDIYLYQETPHHNKIDRYARNYKYDIGFYLGVARVVMPDGTVNFIDSTFSKVLNRNIYDGAQLSPDRFVEYNKAGKCKIINQKGENITEYIYDQIVNSGYKEYYIVTKDDKKGIVDRDGKVTAEIKLSTMYHLTNGLFKTQSAPISIIDIKGDTMINLGYKSIQPYSNNVFHIYNSSESNFTDKNGTVINGPYTKVQVLRDEEIAIGIENEKYYVLDSKGAKRFEVPSSTKVIQHQGEYLVTEVNGLNYVYDIKGKNIFPKGKKRITLTSLGNHIFIEDNNVTGIYDIDTQKWLYPMGQCRVKYVKETNSRKAYIKASCQSETITHTETIDNVATEENTNSSSHGYQTKYDGDTTTIILMDGSQIKYDGSLKLQPQTFGDNGLYFKQRNTKAIFNRNIQKVSPENYTLDRPFYLGGNAYFSMVDTDRKNGLMDINGKWLIPPKKDQRLKTYLGKFISITSKSSYKLVDKNMNPVSSYEYSKVSITGNRENQFLIAHPIDSKYIDIYNIEGKLISTNEYSKEIKVWNDHLIVEKSPNNELESCLIDINGKAEICLPYKSIEPTDEKLDHFIVKDIYDYGIVNRSNEVQIETKYSKIKYHPEIQAYSLTKTTRIHDLISLDFKPIYTNVNSNLDWKKVADIGFTTRGSEGHSYFSKEGKFIKLFDLDLGQPYSSEELSKAQLIRFNTKDKVIFADSNAGTLYEYK